MYGRQTRAARLPSAAMNDRTIPPVATDPVRQRFDERLSVPWWWWFPALGVATLLAAEVHMGYPGVRAWAPYLLLAPLAAATLVGLGRTRVRVEGSDVNDSDIKDSDVKDSELWVGRAHVPLRFVGEVAVIPRDGKRQALGPELDPAAYLLHRAWIGPMLRVRLTDPDDPTPYWIFSTRRPDQLRALLDSIGSDHHT
jgi:Protein of unknown function (DUF3093)